MTLLKPPCGHVVKILGPSPVRPVVKCPDCQLRPLPVRAGACRRFRYPKL